jgi:hypothetical protein
VQKISLDESLAAVAAAQDDGKLSLPAAENIRRWLREPCYAAFRAELTSCCIAGRQQALGLDGHWLAPVVPNACFMHDAVGLAGSTALRLTIRKRACQPLSALPARVLNSGESSYRALGESVAAFARIQSERATRPRTAPTNAAGFSAAPSRFAAGADRRRVYSIRAWALR